MKVFISWSGTRSKKTAALLYKWLPQIINEIDPWMSDSDLKTGGEWGTEIREALEEAQFGILCVTPGNRKREWLLFEAGALSRRVGDAPNRVAPFLIGFESKSDLPMPLARFQSTEPTREDMKKLLLSINEVCLNPRTVEQIDDALDHYWDSFAGPYEVIRSSVTEHTGSRRTDRQVLDDILSGVRSLQNEQGSRSADPAVQVRAQERIQRLLEAGKAARDKEAAEGLPLRRMAARHSLYFVRATSGRDDMSIITVANMTSDTSDMNLRIDAFVTEALDYLGRPVMVDLVAL